MSVDGLDLAAVFFCDLSPVVSGLGAVIIDEQLCAGELIAAADSLLGDLDGLGKLSIVYGKFAAVNGDAALIGSCGNSADIDAACLDLKINCGINYCIAPAACGNNVAAFAESILTVGEGDLLGSTARDPVDAVAFFGNEYAVSLAAVLLGDPDPVNVGLGIVLDDELSVCKLLGACDSLLGYGNGLGDLSIADGDLGAFAAVLQLNAAVLVINCLVSGGNHAAFNGECDGRVYYRKGPAVIFNGVACLFKGVGAVAEHKLNRLGTRYPCNALAVLGDRYPAALELCDLLPVISRNVIALQSKGSALKLCNAAYCDL